MELIPTEPSSEEEEGSPVLELQVSVFHKLIDASTLDSFLTTFSAFSRGFPNDVVWPDFSLAAELFPPRNPPPRNYLKLMEDYWFTEGNYVTRRFVFNSLSISRIRSMVPIKLSRVKALSCFIWQRVMVASGVMSSVTGAPKISILVEAVNLRKVTDPPLSQGLVGNVVWWAVAIASSNSEMAELGSLVSEAIELFRSDDVKLTQGESGYELMTGYCQILRDLQSVEGEELDIMAFTSWCGFGFSGHDFGWGEPIWVTVMGKVGRAFRDLTVFMDSTDGIEAWITLKEEKMSALERDPLFMEFASPNPMISSFD
ncbi:Vinorine synthase [Linum perenne]